MTVEFLFSLLCSGGCCLAGAVVLGGVGFFAFRMSKGGGEDASADVSASADEVGQDEAASPPDAGPSPLDSRSDPMSADFEEDDDDMATVVAPPPSGLLDGIPAAPPPPPPRAPSEDEQRTEEAPRPSGRSVSDAPPPPRKPLPPAASGQTIIAFDDDDDDF